MKNDFSPLLRSAIGFERFAHLVAAPHAQETVNYPLIISRKLARVIMLLRWPSQGLTRRMCTSSTRMGH